MIKAVEQQNDYLIPNYSLVPDDSGNRFIRVYNYIESFPNRSEVLVPHKKDYFLFVFIRKGGSRFWIDQSSYMLKDNTIYIIPPNQVVVKEEMIRLSSTGIAFTKEFLALPDNVSLRTLPLIDSPGKGHELLLTEVESTFIEDIITKINFEYQNSGDWQLRMLCGYLTILLTYLSKLYTTQFTHNDNSPDNILLKSFLTQVDNHFKELHEFKKYASLLNISSNHLSESVKLQSGKPAIKHIHDRLIMESRRLLFHTNKSLKEIASDLGFSDASYFNRFLEEKQV